MTSRHVTLYRWLLAVIIIVTIAAFIYVWQPTIKPIQASNKTFSENQIKQGKEVAAAGACVVCHSAENQPAYAGGLAMDTPFGTIYSTNITPDVDLGIGSWSFEAFDRAMRRGVARDGSYLYPAFPYTHFTHMKDDEMQALYAYMMSIEPVQVQPPKTDLPFPFNIRPLMAGWNLLFLDQDPIEPVKNQTESWNRGYYLVNSSGHCAGCHSPRNILGAEKKGTHYLAGGEAEGWIAPALNQDSLAPVAWTENALFDYLRYGFSSEHGVAAGSMAPVVREATSKVSESDTRAIATYLASFHQDNTKNETQKAQSQATKLALKTLTPPQSDGASMFNSGCAACHHSGDGPKPYGVRPELWLSTTLYLDKPDNVINVVLDGVQNPAHSDLGYMAPFRYSYSDKQVAELVNYMRIEFAGKEPWQDLEKTVARIRDASNSGSK